MPKIKIESGPMSGKYNGVPKDEYMGRIEGVADQVRLTFWNPRDQHSEGAVLEPHEVIKTHNYEGMDCYKVKMFAPRANGAYSEGGQGRAPQNAPRMGLDAYLTLRRNLFSESLRQLVPVVETAKAMGEGEVSATVVVEQAAYMTVAIMVAVSKGDVSIPQPAPEPQPELAGMTEAKPDDNIPF